MSKTNEWNLLKRQLSIELDADFHRRFAELMNRVCGPSKYYQKADPFPARFVRPTCMASGNLSEAFGFGEELFRV